MGGKKVTEGHARLLRMKIVLVTPLYPPDIAQPAPYSKELARRLSEAHEVVVVAYAHIPEEIPNVGVKPVSKRSPLFVRLINFLFVLLRSVKGADCIYAQNGGSVELPAVLVSFVTRKPLLLCFSDATAHKRAKHGWMLKNIEHLAVRRAYKVIHTIPPQRPEILPFQKAPSEKIAQYEMAWQKHLNELNIEFNHAK